MSRELPVDTGVSQGNFNDLQASAKFQVRLFADDNLLYRKIYK